MNRGESGLRVQPQLDENKRRGIFSDRTFLITGGATGMGLDAAKWIYESGGSLILSTSNPEHFDKDAIGTLGTTEGVFPLIADIRDSTTIQAGLKDLSNGGINPTDLVLSHAAGLNKISRKIVEALVPLKNAPEDQREDLLKKAKERIQKLVASQMDYAKAVNFDGSVSLIESLIAQPSLTPRHLVFMSSLLSTFYGVEGFEIPSFYEGVAWSKNMLEKWLKENADRLKAHNIFPTILSAHLVSDSKTGGFLTSLSRYHPPFHPDLSHLPLTKDVNDELIRILSTYPSAVKAAPNYRFVVGKGDVRDSLSPHDPVFFQIPI